MKGSVDLSSASFNGQPLSKIIDELDVHFANGARRDMLSKARELVLSDYHNTMLASGDASEVGVVCAGDEFQLFD